MPHIPVDERTEQTVRFPETKGQFNYAVTTLINDWILAHGLSYDVLCDIDGGLGLAQHEFRRLVYGPYEDSKIAINGSAYTFMDPEPPMSDQEIESMTIRDETTHQTWMKCSPDCGLHLAGPGRVYCEDCDPSVSD